MTITNNRGNQKMIPAVSHSSYRGSRCGLGDSRRIHYRSRRFLKLSQAECPAARFRSGSSRPANSWDNLRDPAAWDPYPPKDPVLLNISYNRKLLKKYILIVFYQVKPIGIYTVLVYETLKLLPTISRKSLIIKLKKIRRLFILKNYQLYKVYSILNIKVLLYSQGDNKYSRGINGATIFSAHL